MLKSFGHDGRWYLYSTLKNTRTQLKERQIHRDKNNRHKTTNKNDEKGFHHTS